MVALQVHVILCSASMTRCPFISSFIYPSVLAGVQSEDNTNNCSPPWVSSLLSNFALLLGPAADAQRNRGKTQTHQ